MALSIQSVYLYPEANADRHHTDRYEVLQFKQPIPVLRRGQCFTCAVRFIEREFILVRDSLKLVFSLGEKSHTLKGTKGVIFVSNDESLELDDSKWGAKIVRNENKTVQIEVSKVFP